MVDMGSVPLGKLPWCCFHILLQVKFIHKIQPFIIYMYFNHRWLFVTSITINVIFGIKQGKITTFVIFCYFSEPNRNSYSDSSI